MKKRSYKITFGLKEGYSPEGKEYPISFAEESMAKWMNNRIGRGRPVVPGLLQNGTLFSPPARPNETSSVSVAPAAIFTGELSSRQDMLRKNKEVKCTLESLAKELKKDLNQESVFIVYRKKNWRI